VQDRKVGERGSRREVWGEDKQGSSRIHLFLGLLDPAPDPLVRGMDMDMDTDPAPDPDPSIIKQK
jgi:hypothetical protein